MHDIRAAEITALIPAEKSVPMSDEIANVENDTRMLYAVIGMEETRVGATNSVLYSPADQMSTLSYNQNELYHRVSVRSGPLTARS